MTLPKPDPTTGKVRIFDIEADAYKDVWPVDAREQITLGVARLHKDESATTEEEAPAAPTAATTDDLMALTRAELNDACASKGIDGEAFQNKAQCVEALIGVGYVLPPADDQ